MIQVKALVDKKVKRLDDTLSARIGENQHNLTMLAKTGVSGSPVPAAADGMLGPIISNDHAERESVNQSNDDEYIKMLIRQELEESMKDTYEKIDSLMLDLNQRNGDKGTEREPDELALKLQVKVEDHEKSIQEIYTKHIKLATSVKIVKMVQEGFSNQQKKTRRITDPNFPVFADLKKSTDSKRIVSQILERLYVLDQRRDHLFLA